MFTKYADRVFETYQKKKERGLLSLNLAEPTPSKLKQECSIVYLERYKEKDGKTLRLFFLPKEDTSDYGLSIRNIDTDKLKPLSNFLKGRTVETDDKNIELLAWLIDFQPRPYDHKYDYTEAGLDDYDQDDETEESEKPDQKITGPDSGNSDEGEAQGQDQPIENERAEPLGYRVGKRSEPSGGNNGIGKVFMGSTLAVSIALAGYFGLKYKRSGNITPSEKVIDSPKIQGDSEKASIRTDIQETLQTIKRKDRGKEGINFVNIAEKKEKQCMYWNEDHYEKAFCNDEDIPASLIALDRELLENFRKITFPDTITYQSINKVWYLKSGNKFEYFTAPGNHPVKNIELKKLSKYIIDTHILK
ncbi:hypothetical protein HNP38_002628 [Chryseobacterium defluvii]|uniref:Uncharacterized protein n=1 Tax=Chryseobacterium defluvii TaxID=160396 RepID=A0A840KI15_9FLAO|nr:hypothetical protein [Chryseobacterium defluvii]MBB4807324.1 hypothetical protein [Chryseobacterium defluvii]